MAGRQGRSFDRPLSPYIDELEGEVSPLRRRRKKTKGYRWGMICIGLLTMAMMLVFIPLLQQAVGSTVSVAATPQTNRIIIPRLHLSLTLFGRTTEKTLSQGATLWRDSTLAQRPVVTAHSGITNHTGFDHLDSLKKGDRFIIQYGGKKQTYAVFKKEVVAPAAVDKVKPVAKRQWATLVTCTPYMVNSHRLLVTGRRITNQQQALSTTLKPIQTHQARRLWQLSIAGLGVFLVLMTAAGILTWRHRRKGQR